MNSFFPKNVKKTTILVYHNIPVAADKTKLQSDSVNKDQFDLQMRFLRDQSFNVISLKKLVTNLEQKKIEKKTVVITFDDGYRTNLSNALSILKKYDIPATIFLAAGYIGRKQFFPWLDLHNDAANSEDLTPMDWDEVKELFNAGIEIGSHTVSHKFLPKMDREAIEREVLQSQAIIEERVGEKPGSFALPFSFPVFHWKWPSFRSAVMNALKKGGYTCCCTLLRGHITRKTNPFLLKRIVIGKIDDLKSFHAKLCGTYACTRFPQMIYQQFLKQY